MDRKLQATSDQNKSPDDIPSPNIPNEGENLLIQCKGCLKSFLYNGIKKHLAQKPSCKEDYTEADEFELQKILDSHKKTILNKSKNKETHPFQPGKNIIKLEIYSHGDELIDNYPLDTRNEFLKRRRKKEEIWIKLSQSIDKIAKSHENEDDWLKNLVGVENSLYDLVKNHTNEIEEWRDIWTDKHDIEQFLSNITKDYRGKYQASDEIWKMKLHLQDNNIKTNEDLSKKIKVEMLPYTEDKIEAIALAKQIDKDAVQVKVKKLLTFTICSLQNVYQYNVQKILLCFENIKQQHSIDEELPYLNILKGLNITVSQDNIDEINFDHVICKGCPKTFTEKTILKHLKHPANKKCLTNYDNGEIKQMENIGKLHQLIAMQQWRKTYQKMHSETTKLNKTISRTILKLNSTLRLKNGFPVKKCLVKVNQLLKEKCELEKENRISEIQIQSAKLEDIVLKSSNHADAENELSQWQRKIEGDILETFQHLEKEIDRKYDYYFNGFLVNPDDMVRKAK